MSREETSLPPSAAEAGVAAHPGRRPPSPAQRLALVTLPLGVALVLVEVALWVLGLGTPAPDADAFWSRGFDPQVDYLVPTDDGGWRTRLFGGTGRPELVIPPKGDRARVLLVGGSNVQILPGEALEQELTELFPQRGWQVVNLGRQGYGTARVALLLEQAMALEPDVVVVSAGNNEFLELAFRQELEARGGTPLVMRLARLASGLRLFNLVLEGVTGGETADLLDTVRTEPDADTDETRPKDAGDPALLTHGWEQARATWDEYAQTLEAMCRRVREAGVPVVLCTLLGNDFSPPVLSSLPPDLTPDEEERFQQAIAGAFTSFPIRWRAGFYPPVHLKMRQWYYGRDNEPGEGEASWTPVLRPLSGPLLLTERTAGEARSPEGAHWPPPERWDRHVVLLLKAMERLVARELEAGDADKLRRSDGHLVEALEIVPDHPDSLFARGIIAWLLREDDAVVADWLARAADADRAPRSANRLSNGLVRAVADRVPGVTLLDAEALYRKRTPNGLLGYEILMDACHLQPGIRHAYVRDIARAVGPLLP